MAFIGIIAETKNEMQIKRIIDNNLNSIRKEHTIIVINDKNVENIRNIRFETILVINLAEIINKNQTLNELFENTKYLIINSDIEYDNLKLINNMELNVITFGFNQKATITASSVEENLMLCLQRKIIDINKNVLEPQEIKVKQLSRKLQKNSHNSMGIASIMLIYGKKEINF